MKFIYFVKYKDRDAIARARSAHFAYADGLREQGALAIGGPVLDEQGERIGLVFVYEAASKEAALRLVREDPFTLANALNVEHELLEWRIEGLNPALLITDPSAHASEAAG